MRRNLFTLIASSVLLSPVAMANNSTPVMFSTLNQINAPSKESVGGIRLSVLHGQVSEVKGVDFSLLGMSETDRTVGVNFGLLFGASKVNQEMKGLSLGWFNWNDGQTTGLNLGTVNVTHDVKGVNWSAVNYSTGHTMADVGLASISDKSNFQLGFFNMTNQIEGIQIGLLNCADNGFLKCFPLINFPK